MQYSLNNMLDFSFKITGFLLPLACDYYVWNDAITQCITISITPTFFRWQTWLCSRNLKQNRTFVQIFIHNIIVKSVHHGPLYNSDRLDQLCRTAWKKEIGSTLTIDLSHHEKCLNLAKMYQWNKAKHCQSRNLWFGHSEFNNLEIITGTKQNHGQPTHWGKVISEFNNWHKTKPLSTQTLRYGNSEFNNLEIITYIKLNLCQPRNFRFLY